LILSFFLFSIAFALTDEETLKVIQEVKDAYTLYFERFNKADYEGECDSYSTPSIVVAPDRTVWVNSDKEKKMQYFQLTTQMLKKIGWKQSVIEKLHVVPYSSFLASLTNVGHRESLDGSSLPFRFNYLYIKDKDGVWRIESIFDTEAAYFPIQCTGKGTYMKNSYEHSLYVPLSIDKAWEVVDFGSPVYGARYVGSPNSVGSVRQLQNPQKTEWFNETQVMRMDGPTFKSYHYALQVPHNSYDFTYYIAKVELYSETLGTGTFVKWTGQWDGGNDQVIHLIGRIAGAIKVLK